MAHFAEINESGLVTRVIVADQEFINSGFVGDPANWIQTSYNTRGGIHYGPDGQPDGGEALRGNYAGIGFLYDRDLDAFIPPSPFPSWVLNTNSCSYEAPTPYPDDGQLYDWDEPSKSWFPRLPA